MTSSSSSEAPPRRRLLRKFSGLIVLVAALTLVGGVYAAAAPNSNKAADSSSQSVAAQAGKQLFDQSCVTCHGNNAEGVTGRGPSLIGVGSAAVYFQVSTGRMPLTGQSAQAERKQPQYNDAQINQLGAYIESLGGGPQLPKGNLRTGDLGKGGELFRLNCAECHNFAGSGGALSSGKTAPSLSLATDKQIYAAMQTGPENMPTFADNEITPKQKREIINYIQSIKAEQDPGGFGLGRIGPVPEGLIAFIVGIALAVLATLWIGVKE
jgi:ubiquinol-cytochrome c reductase cytochrome c subunit